MAKILVISTNTKNIDTELSELKILPQLLNSISKHDVHVMAFSWTGEDQISTLESGAKLSVYAADAATHRRGNTQKQRFANGNRDLTIYLLRESMAKFKNAVRKQLVDTDLVILDSFSAAPLFDDLNLNGLPVIYVSHNAETALAQQTHRENSLDVQVTSQMEELALSLCDVYTYCSEEDEKSIRELCKTEKKSVHIPISNESSKDTFASVAESLLSAEAIFRESKKDMPKKKILMYSIIRNRENQMAQYHKQISDVVKAFPEHEFYLSIYENDSTDRTRQMLFSFDWSMLSGVSMISENLNTKYFGSVKDGERVMNLAIARNKAIEAAGFLDTADYVLMFEGDVRFGVGDIRELLEFETVEPDFDIVSAMSIRSNGTFYDVWATRTTEEYQKGVMPLEPGYRTKHYGRYLSTSSGLCLYRAKPFQEGARHHWINKKTGEADCEMVVVCQDFRARGYDNIFIDYRAKAYH